MRAQRFLSVMLAIVVCPAIAGAEEHREGEAEVEPAPDEGEPEPAEPSPAPAGGPEAAPEPEEPAPTMSCDRVECNCASPPEVVEGDIVFRSDPSRTCGGVVFCRCVEPVTPEPEPPSEQETERLGPPPVGGVTISDRKVGLLVEVGFPYYNVQLSYGLHDAVELGVGYRGFWFLTSAGYVSLRLRLYHNPHRLAAISLYAAAGYSYIHPEMNYSYNNTTSLVGGDATHGLLGLSTSMGRGRHLFIFNIAAHLGWVQSWEGCEEDDWDSRCYEGYFRNGQRGLAVAVLFEFGYAVRMSRSSTFFVTLGSMFFVNNDEWAGYGTGKIGFVFDLATSRGGRGRR